MSRQTPSRNVPVDPPSSPTGAHIGPSGRRPTMRYGNSLPEPHRSVPPPTPVSLPVRDGLRTIELPLNQSYEGLESLADEQSVSPSLIYETEPEDDGTSELSVVFRGAHQSERPPAGSSGPDLRLVSSLPRSAPPPPPPTARTLPPDSLAGEEPITEAYLQPPPVPAEIPPPAAVPMPPPVPPPAAPAPVDYDDEVETAVMPSKIPPADSLRPVEVRPDLSVPTIRASVPPPPRRPNLLAIGAAALVGVGIIAAAAFWMRKEQGDLVIDVADQQCGAVDSVQVFVDEELVCTESPCTLRVDVGSHIVSAKAEGYALTPAQAVVVDPQVPTLHRVQFGSTTKTGVEVRTEAKGYALYLDGKLVGDLPQRVTGLTSGEHSLLISGGEGFYAEERKVDLKEDELTVIDNIVLKPRNGTLRVAMNDQLRGATVLLDGERVSLPFDRELDASKRYHLVAKKAGFEDFETWVEFDGSAKERDLNIQLMPRQGSEESNSDPSESASDSDRSESRVSRSRRSRSSASAASGEESKASGQARLSLLSDPPAAVLLDGKPMGQTPRRVSVEPGTHSVLFIHPTKGRARATAKLAAGQAKTLRAKF